MIAAQAAKIFAARWTLEFVIEDAALHKDDEILSILIPKITWQYLKY